MLSGAHELLQGSWAPDISMHSFSTSSPQWECAVGAVAQKFPELCSNPGNDICCTCKIYLHVYCGSRTTEIHIHTHKHQYNSPHILTCTGVLSHTPYEGDVDGPGLAPYQVDAGHVLHHLLEGFPPVTHRQGTKLLSIQLHNPAEQRMTRLTNQQY